MSAGGAGRFGAGRLLAAGVLAGLFAGGGCNQQSAKKDYVSGHKPGEASAATNATLAGQSDDNPPTPQDLASIDALYVNNDRITIAQILEPIHNILEEKRGELTAMAYRQFVADGIKSQTRDQIRNLLIYQEAIKGMTEDQIKYLDSVVDQEIKKRVNEQFGGRQTRLESYLESVHSSLDLYRERLRREVITVAHVQRTIQPILSDPTRSELVNFYNENIDRFTTPPQAELRLIEISVDSQLDNPGSASAATDSSREAARSKARQRMELVARKLREGGDFCEMARLYSTGIHSRECGSWGMIRPGSMRGPFEKPAETLFTLQERQISGIIETDEAFFIVQAGKVIPAQKPSFVEIQKRLVEEFRDHQLDALVGEHAQKLYEKAQVKPDESRFMMAAFHRIFPSDSISG